MSNKQHYSEQYYLEVYSKFLESSDYNYKLSLFWMFNIFLSRGFTLKDKMVLDFGCGTGYLSQSIQASCYDVSEYILNKLKQEGRDVFYSLDDIQSEYFDYVFASHSIEHAISPAQEFAQIKRILKPDGHLFLILPLEKYPGKPTYQADIHRHYYTWSFQNLTNLLNDSGYKIYEQSIIYGPTGLKYFKSMSTIQILGKLMNNWPSIFVIASLK